MLTLENLSFDVADAKGEIGIIKDLSLTVDEGEFVVITGPNGGGKSTLAKLIAGILEPTGGRIYFDGEDITHRNVTDRANMGISYAFQQPVRFKGLHVLDLLRLAARGGSGKELAAQGGSAGTPAYGEGRAVLAADKKPLSAADACEYLSEVGLCAKDYINREVNASLSGGELKRIEIATVLARSSRLSLFDEPEAGIDLWSFQNLIQVFERMRERVKGSVLIISHQERILNIADKIVVIGDGQVVKEGPREQILPEILGTASAVDACSRFYRDGRTERTDSPQEGPQGGERL